MAFKEYDPRQVTVSLAGNVLRGFADGTFVRVQMESDAFTDVVGTDGEVSRSRSSDDRATVTFLLMQTSDSNDVLSALHNLDKTTPGGAGVGALEIRDRNGRAYYRAAEAWISKAPDVEFGREPGPREWAIRCAKMIRVDGGN